MMTNPHCSHKEPEDIATLVFFVKRLIQLLSGQTHYFSFDFPSLSLHLIFVYFNFVLYRGERKPKVDPKVELFRTCIAAIPRYLE